MIFEGMLKWAVGKDDRPINSTKSLKKRRKVHVDMHSGDGQVELISGCCKQGTLTEGPSSRFLHKNRHRVGIVKNYPNHNVPDNNNSTYMDDNYRRESPTDTNNDEDEAPHNNNNNNIINADSKSLLYMSLDHLPMAIVKQYERMLQDAPLKQPPQSILKSRHTAPNNNRNHHRPSNNIKIQQPSHQPNNPSSKKSNSKSVTLHDHGGRSKGGSSRICSLGPDKKIPQPQTVTITTTTPSPQISIKEAHNRPLKVLSSITPLPPPPPKEKCERRRSRSSSKSPEAFNEKYPHNLLFPSSNNSTKVTSKVVPIPAKEKRTLNHNNNICDDFNPSKNVSIPSTKKVLPLPVAKKTVTSQPVQENDENDPNPQNQKISCPPNPPDQLLPSKNSGEPGSKPGTGKPHDTTDPQFLEKSITYSTPPIPKCAKKLTLKRSELRKLERLKSQTERLNRFLKKYYLPNLPEEEEEQCSPEEKSLCLSILRTHWREVKSSDNNPNGNKSHWNNETNKNPSRRHSSTSNNRFSPLLSSSLSSTDPVGADHSVVSWQNLRNAALISHPNDSTLLPIIQEDSGEISSSSTASEYQQEAETARDIRNILDDSFLMSSNSHLATAADDSFVFFTSESMGLSSEKRDRMRDNVKISYAEQTQLDLDDDAEGGFGRDKLKGLLVEPLGDFFDTPASLAEDEGFMSPYPPEAYSPASSSSTFNRFSVSSSSGKGSGSTGNEHENLGDYADEDGDDYDEDEDKEEAEISNLPHTQTSSSSSSEIEVNSMPGSEVEEEEKYDIMEELKNGNYPLVDEDGARNDNETWNSHGYFPTSPCGTTSHPSSSSGDDQLENKRENEDEEEESFVIPSSMPFSTPRSKRLRTTSRGSYRFSKKSTPRRIIVRKPPVNSAFSDKGEILIRTYKNGDYVTVHVLRVRRLQPHYRSSWKLSIKISLLPEAETTFTTRSETILVPRNRSWAKIDQKFSFEIGASETSQQKIFLTFVKRLERRTLFLGWTTLDLEDIENSESWLKLRTRKMSTATYPSMQQSSTNHCHSNFMSSSGGGTTNSSSSCSNSSRSGPFNSTSPLPVHVEETSPTGCDCGMEPKSQLQNSSTMDSGVEDCCEPPLPPPTPTVDLDDKVGQRVSLKMVKQDGGGYGFSVVWVSPPRIERLEKGKTGDIAGLRIGDLIIGVNGEDVTTLPNTTIYTKMKTTGNELELEVWRKYPQVQPRSSLQVTHAHPTPPLRSSSISTANENTSLITSHSNESCQNREIQQPPCAACLPQHIKSSSTNSNSPVPVKGRIQPQPPPVSILKPPPPPPPTIINSVPSQSQQQPPPGSSSWRIRFNIELLDNEDDCLKQFFICELKFFRKIVAGLDRYLIPAQANHLLTPQEINLIFSHVIKIITVTKRILNCVADGSSSSEWKLGRILLSTHSDHLSEIVSAYSSYAKTLGYSGMILSEKMSLQEFARFVLETPVPKGHLDLTSLLFAPFEHLRNICEICEEISHSNDDWVELSNNLKECYADIVCETDFMEPISHVSMKKNPLLSVRDLEKRIVSTTCQPLKVCEKGRRWLFGSRLFKKESDGSWTPVWAFLFSDIIVLTSHTTRDRVFFVKEAPIRLEDVVTLHFSLPRKHENEFRLLFGPDVQQSRLDKILPIHRNKKCHQIILRAPNVQLKSVWKLLLQRQIITLNTRLSKSSSSNFSISEFCERFPVSHPEPDEVRRLTSRDPHQLSSKEKVLQNSNLLHPQSSQKLSGDAMAQKTIFDRQNYPDERNLSVIKEEKSYSQTIKSHQKPYAPDGLSSITKDLLKSRIPRVADHRNRVEAIPEEIKVASKPQNVSTDTVESQTVTQDPIPTAPAKTETSSFQTTRIDQVSNSQAEVAKVPLDTLRSDSTVRHDAEQLQIPQSQVPAQVQAQPIPAKRNLKTNSSLNNNNNNEVHDFNLSNKNTKDKCPCESVQENSVVNAGDNDLLKKEMSAKTGNDKVFLNEKNFFENGPHCYPQSSPKPLAEIRQISLSSNKIGGKGKPQSVTDVTAIYIKNESNSYKYNSKVADTEPSQTEVPLSDTLHHGEQEFKERLQRNNTPSPSLNNRVEALKHEGGNIMKGKPGSRILTNATLKSRQQEVLAFNKGETMRSEQSQAVGNLGTVTDSTLKQSESRPSTKDMSSSPILHPPRCQSENGYVKSKPVHTDSPIMSGFGSERTRRRLLYDYKVQRDYPELFGITPKDRRSFIKRLAEKQPENDKSLVAPYYFSPLPTPKFAKPAESVVNKADFKEVCDTATFLRNARNETQLTTSKCNGKEGKFNEPPPLPAPSSSKATKEKVEIETSLESEEIDDRVINEVNLKEAVQGILREVMDDETDEDSDESGGHEIRAQVHRHRSPEESSNDSGISDEVTEKSKPLSGFEEENERFQSNMAVNSSEVTKANFTPPKNNNTVTLLTHCREPDQMPKALACNSKNPTPSPNNKIDDLYFVEGEEEAGVEAMVVLKADKATGMDDDFFNSSWSSKTEKSLRTIMAERREAFFSSYQSNNSCQIGSYSGPSSYSVPVNEPPLIVKIVDGGKLQSTLADLYPSSSNKSPPSERVKLTCFEKEKTARVERVESSDDSTSSDIASASPAAENGTTDPSWSSSSSSLAGYASSKEEPSSSAGIHSITCSDSSFPATANGQPVPSTSSRMIISDLSNGLPSSSFSTVSNRYGSKGPEIVVTQESPETPTAKTSYSLSDDGDEDDSILCNGSIDAHFSLDGQRKGFLRVESNDSTAENYGDDDDYNFDDEEDDLSQCSVATINRYGTYESLEKLENIESEDSVGGLPDFSRPMPRSKARFTFEDEDSDDDNDLFEEDFESDFNFRFPSQIQDNTYSVSRLGPLPPLLEEDYEDEIYDEQRMGISSPCSSAGASGSEHTSMSNSLRSRHEVSAELGLQGVNQRPHDLGQPVSLEALQTECDISPLVMLSRNYEKRLLAHRNTTSSK